MISQNNEINTSKRQIHQLSSLESLPSNNLQNLSMRLNSINEYEVNNEILPANVFSMYENSEHMITETPMTPIAQQTTTSSKSNQKKRSPTQSTLSDDIRSDSAKSKSGRGRKKSKPNNENENENEIVQLDLIRTNVRSESHQFDCTPINEDVIHFYHPNWKNSNSLNANANKIQCHTPIELTFSVSLLKFLCSGVYCVVFEYGKSIFADIECI